jgi:hypothetical protein
MYAEFGDAKKRRYADAKARCIYAGTSPITRQSGKNEVVSARYGNGNRLIDGLGLQAFAALTYSPGARTYNDQLRRRGTGHHAAPGLARLRALRHRSRLHQDRPPLRRGKAWPRIEITRLLIDKPTSWDVLISKGQKRDDVTDR